jgi:hypothetical protein
VAGGARFAAVIGIVCATPLTGAGAQQPGATRVMREYGATLTAEQGWESNVLFQRPDDPGDMVSRAGATAVGTLQTARTRAGVNARGDIARYRTLDELNTSTYGFGADVRRRLTPRLSAFVAATAQTSLSSVLQPQQSGAAQPLLPLSLSRSVGANAGAAYQLSPTLGGTTEAGYTRVRFDDSGLADGTTARGALAIARRYDVDASYGAAYQYERSETRGETPTVQTAAATWDPTFAGISVRLRAGVSAIDATAATPVTYAPTGGAELRRSLAGGIVGLRANRAASMAFGFGDVFTTDEVALAYDRASFRRTVAHVSLDRSWSRTPGEGTVDIGSLGAVAEIRRAFRSGVSVGTGVFARRRSQGVVVNNRGVRLNFNYTKSGR